MVTSIRRHPLTLDVSIPGIVLSKCYPRLSQSALYMKTERNLSDSLGKSQQTSFKLSSENESSICGSNVKVDLFLDHQRIDPEGIDAKWMSPN